MHLYHWALKSLQTRFGEYVRDSPHCPHASKKFVIFLWIVSVTPWARDRWGWTAVIQSLREVNIPWPILWRSGAIPSRWNKHHFMPEGAIPLRILPLFRCSFTTYTQKNFDPENPCIFTLQKGSLRVPNLLCFDGFFNTKKTGTFTQTG